MLSTASLLDALQEEHIVENEPENALIVSFGHGT